MIDVKEISYEDLIKLYQDKCVYCETLEERLQKSNKRNDELTERLNIILAKSKKVKDKYQQLYDFAEGLTNIIEERDNDIKELIRVNDELVKVNEKLQGALKTKTISQISVLEILRHV